MGVLSGYTILEFAGMGGGPFAGMLLADMGADVVRLERPPATGKADPTDVLNRGKRSLCVNLKAPGAVDLVIRMVARSQGLIESYRPGVMERLGLGPGPCLAASPALVYGRLTGWGQEGPLAKAAGHDINYIALAGALAHIGSGESGPVPPLSLVSDYAGGGMLLAMGMLGAWVESSRSGRGQVVDAAMLDGAALLMASVYARQAGGRWAPGRGGNFMDGAAHYYTTYRCADGRWLSIGPIEPEFYALLMKLCGVEEAEIPPQNGDGAWVRGRKRLAALFAAKPRDEWCRLLEGTDACVAPVLEVSEAPAHPHNIARSVFSEAGGVVQPSPAPRFSRTPSSPVRPAPAKGGQADDILEGFGLSAAEIADAKAQGAVAAGSMPT